MGLAQSQFLSVTCTAEMRTSARGGRVCLLEDLLSADAANYHIAAAGNSL